MPALSLCAQDLGLMRIGEFLVRSSVLSHRQVDQILHRQLSLRREQGKWTVFGRLAIECECMTEHDLGCWIEAKALVERIAKGRTFRPHEVPTPLGPAGAS